MELHYRFHRRQQSPAVQTPAGRARAADAPDRNSVTDLTTATRSTVDPRGRVRDGGTGERTAYRRHAGTIGPAARSGEQPVGRALSRLQLHPTAPPAGTPSEGPYSALLARSCNRSGIVPVAPAPRRGCVARAVAAQHRSCWANIARMNTAHPPPDPREIETATINLAMSRSCGYGEPPAEGRRPRLPKKRRAMSPFSAASSPTPARRGRVRRRSPGIPRSGCGRRRR